jgi:hypothetical protein
MTKALWTLVLLPFAAAFATPSFAGAGSEVPQFGFQQICRATSDISLGDEQDNKQCMADEAGAKKQLASKWTSYPAGARSRCSAETQIGGDPSYVELETCLDLDDMTREGATAGMRD